MKIKPKYNNHQDLLKQIILASMLVAMSICIQHILIQLPLTKLVPEHFKRKFSRMLFKDFLCFIPLLMIPLYSNKYVSFLAVSLSEGIAFWYFGSSSGARSVPYKPELSIIFGIIWGLCPSLFLNKKNNSFTKVYFCILLLFIFHFFFYDIYGLILYGKVFNAKIHYDLITNMFNCSHATKLYILFRVIIKFFSLFTISLINTYLYLRIKKQVLLLFETNI
ncbi:hypothetical protein [Candidatus Phytoplasma fraxini]|uniref:Integral membrane protein n=1 Tax=Ash yellows phytoplasma TaxID=35780 RepID=A0ABZ2UA12_ASHYP